jgi:hypothetical protein
MISIFKDEGMNLILGDLGWIGIFLGPPLIKKKKRQKNAKKKKLFLSKLLLKKTYKFSFSTFWPPYIRSLSAPTMQQSKFAHTLFIYLFSMV